MSALDALQSVRYVTANGKRFAVLEAEDWEAMIDWLEEEEDLSIIRQAYEPPEATESEPGGSSGMR